MGDALVIMAVMHAVPTTSELHKCNLRCLEMHCKNLSHL